MATKYLDKDGLLYFWQKIKNVFVTDVTYNSTSKKIQKTKAGATSDVVTLSTVATSGSYTDLSDKPTIPEAVQKTSTTPKMNGTAAIGSETKYAAGDHVHPTDTSRVPTTRKVNGHALSADVTVTASDVGAVPTTRTVNSKELSDDISLTASDVGAVPTTRTVNGHALSADVTVTASDIGVESGAEVNQNAFSNVKVGSTTVAADAKTDTLELVAGSNVTLTPDATNDKITIAATDTTYSDATTSAHGLMTAADKTKLNGIATGAEVNQNAFSNVKVDTVTVAANAKTDTLELIAGTNITITPDATNDAITIAATDTTYSDATTSAHGLMTAADKTKLNGIAEGAEVNVNADWNASSGDAKILNKPTLGAAAAKGVVSSISSDSTDLPTVTAVKNYVASSVTGAVAFQGTAPTTFAPTNYKAGFYWVVGTAGTYCSQTCEPGDMIFATSD